MAIPRGRVTVMTVNSVGIRKCKRPSGALEWRAYVMDDDVAGAWLFTPEASTCLGGDSSGNPRWCYVGMPDYPGVAVLHLIPRHGWWFAHITHHAGEVVVSVDICTPARFVDNTWEYVDLELDLLGRGNSVRVADEDELADAQTRGLIGEEEAARALEATATVKGQLETQEPPFDCSLAERLAAANALQLPPLFTPRGSDVPFYR